MEQDNHLKKLIEAINKSYAQLQSVQANLDNFSGCVKDVAEKINSFEKMSNLPEMVAEAQKISDELGRLEKELVVNQQNSTNLLTGARENITAFVDESKSLKTEMENQRQFQTEVINMMRENKELIATQGQANAQILKQYDEFKNVILEVGQFASAIRDMKIASDEGVNLIRQCIREELGEKKSVDSNPSKNKFIDIIDVFKRNI